jgi:hypothetical protein
VAKSNDDDEISDVLRLHKKGPKQIQHIIDMLDVLFAEAPPTTQPFYVYRGVEEKEYLNLDGFCSTTMDINVTQGYMGESDGGYIMRILIPVGSRVIPLYRIPIFSQIDEHEVLLDRRNTSVVNKIPSEYNDVEVYDVTYQPW